MGWRSWPARAPMMRSSADGHCRYRHRFAGCLAVRVPTPPFASACQAADYVLAFGAAVVMPGCRLGLRGLAGAGSVGCRGTEERCVVGLQQK